MKDETIGSIVLAAYCALVLAWSGLFIHQVVSNRIEDRAAVKKISVEEGTIFSSISGYVAFSKAGNEEIDEIKVYGRSMVGCRCLASLTYTRRYHPGDSEFEIIKGKYFSQP